MSVTYGARISESHIEATSYLIYDPPYQHSLSFLVKCTQHLGDALPSSHPVTHLSPPAPSQRNNHHGLALKLWRLLERSFPFLHWKEHTVLCVLELLSVSQPGVCELQLPSRCSRGLCFITKKCCILLFLCRCEESLGEGQLAWPNVSCQVSTFVPLGPVGRRYQTKGPLSFRFHHFAGFRVTRNMSDFFVYTGVCRHLLS